MKTLKKIWWLFGLLAMASMLMGTHIVFAGLLFVLIFVGICAQMLSLSARRKMLRANAASGGYADQYKNWIASAPKAMITVPTLMMTVFIWLLFVADVALCWLLTFDALEMADVAREAAANPSARVMSVAAFVVFTLCGLMCVFLATLRTRDIHKQLNAFVKDSAPAEGTS